MLTTAERIKTMQERLNQLTPTKIEIIDQSAAHHGHEGAQRGGGHFALSIASPKFSDQSLVACHKLVYAALGDLMQHEIHALQITVVR